MAQGGMLYVDFIMDSYHYLGNCLYRSYHPIDFGVCQNDPQRADHLVYCVNRHIGTPDLFGTDDYYLVNKKSQQLCCWLFAILLVAPEEYIAHSLALPSRPVAQTAMRRC